MFRLAEPDNNDMPALIKFLKTNGYELEDVKVHPRFKGSAQAIFSKIAHIDYEGNDINDATIEISIDFDRRFDYKNIAWMEEEHTGEEILEKARDFVEKLIDGSYENAKGNRKRKTRKNMRTRKNIKK